MQFLNFLTFLGSWWDWIDAIGVGLGKCNAFGSFHHWSMQLLKAALDLLTFPPAVGPPVAFSINSTTCTVYRLLQLPLHIRK